MHRKDNQLIIKRFTDKFNKYGYSQKTLGWDKGRQELRFKILAGHWPLVNRRILDFGCGFGDMYGYFRKKRTNLYYEGVDVNPLLIAEGKKKYPQAKLSVASSLKTCFKKKYDYIFSSGVHNTKISNNKKFIEESFRSFDKFSLRGFAVNFLSNKVSRKTAHAFHADPAYILDLAYKYSNRITLRNDYMPFEFSVFVDKQNSFDRNKAVYREFIKDKG